MDLAPLRAFLAATANHEVVAISRADLVVIERELSRSRGAEAMRAADAAIGGVIAHLQTGATA